ncbi:hypothetical protein CIG75_12590 [Tumebacillus algifaecis]|uniref:ATP-grasp domain-containing protein n=1 Tax=Tumebacillus algifaecis TaxID=1214604 RepID=A0A223D258_9BACL|nr:YheC/YheD family protein [Tumebacillus algifaecis]ASS75738.1 hypothetical protein CIG75_12590 [Tumebacillus algifaecis]
MIIMILWKRGDGQMKLAPGSKWSKHLIFLASPELRHDVPETKLYSKATLATMINRHGEVFVKPVYGGGGFRIFRVKRLAGRFEVKMEHQKRVVSSLDSVVAWIDSVRKGSRFLVQQGIALAKWRGRPVDVRTIVQKNEAGRWEVTRLFAKAAGSGLAVTNLVIGGSALTVRAYLMSNGYTSQKAQSAIRRLKAKSVRIAKRFGGRYSNAIYGLDIGLDRQGKFWLIEVNTAPQLSIFKKGTLSRSDQRSLMLWNLHGKVNRAAEVHRGSWRRHK